MNTGLIRFAWCAALSCLGLAVCLSGPSAAWSQPGALRLQAGTTTAVSLVDPEAMVTIEVTSELVDLALPSGKSITMLFTWAMEPASGLVVWRYLRASELEPADRIAAEATRARYFVGDGELVAVVLSKSAPTVYLQKSALRVGSAAEGRARAVADMEAEAPRIDAGTARGVMVGVDPRQFLPRRFYHDGKSSHRWTEPKILGLRREGSGWILTLEGEPGYVAELVLDANFLQTSARLIAEPPRVRFEQEGPPIPSAWIDLAAYDGPRYAGEIFVTALSVVFELPDGTSFKGSFLYARGHSYLSPGGQGPYWWRFELGEPRTEWVEEMRDRSRFFVRDGGLIEVRSFDGGARLELLASKMLPPRVTDNGEALAFLKERALTLQEQPLELGIDIFPSQVVAAWSEKAGTTTEVVGLEPSGDGWVLTVIGETGAMARIALDEEFRAVGGELVHDHDVAE